MQHLLQQRGEEDGRILDVRRGVRLHLSAIFGIVPNDSCSVRLYIWT